MKYECKQRRVQKIIANNVWQNFHLRKKKVENNFLKKFQLSGTFCVRNSDNENIYIDIEREKKKTIKIEIQESVINIFMVVN